MAEKILLINPKKRPSKRRTTKGKKIMARKTARRRTPAQNRATKKLVAFNRRRKSPARKTRRRRNPTTAIAPPRRRRAYRRAVAAYAPNPIRRKRRSARRTSVKRRRNPIRARGLLNSVVIPAATAATGAIALDIAWAYLPIPEEIKTGTMKHMAKAAGAVGLTYVASMIPGVKKSTAERLGVGALTVSFYNMARDFIQTSAPEVKMDGMGYYNPALPAQMGLYVPGSAPSGVNTGEVSPELGYYANSY